MQRASLRVLKGGCRGPTTCSWCRFDSSGIPAGKSLTGSCPKNQHRARPPSLVLGQGRSEPSSGHQTQPNQIQPNQPKPNPTNPTQTKPPPHTLGASREPYRHFGLLTALLQAAIESSAPLPRGCLCPSLCQRLAGHQPHLTPAACPKRAVLGFPSQAGAGEGPRAHPAPRSTARGRSRRSAKGRSPPALCPPGHKGLTRCSWARNAAGQREASCPAIRQRRRRGPNPIPKENVAFTAPRRGLGTHGKRNQPGRGAESWT